MSSNIVRTRELCTQVRKLDSAELNQLARILCISDGWKKLMAMVPKEGKEDFFRFTSDTIALVEQAAHIDHRSAAEIFLEEWSTMNEKKVTIGDLVKLLVKAELFRAADYICTNILKQDVPQRPQYGPAAQIDISDESIAELLKEKKNINKIVENQQQRNEIFIGINEELNKFNENDKYTEERLGIDNETTKDITDGLIEISIKQEESNLLQLPGNESDVIGLNLQDDNKKSMENFHLISEALTSNIPIFVNNDLFNSDILKNNIESNFENSIVNLNDAKSSPLSQSISENIQIPVGALEMLQSSNEHECVENTKVLHSKELSSSPVIPVMVMEMNSDDWLK